MDSESVTVREVGREHAVFKYDASAIPVLTIRSGERVCFHTLDARCGLLRVPEDVGPTTPDFSQPFPKVDPATGPVAVAGAVPGDSLAVTIEAIELDHQGFVIVKPDMGVMRGMVDKPVAKVVPVGNGHIEFSDDLRLPVRPMVGVVATAPRGAPLASAFVGDTGGNMDNNRVTVGATVYLPVQVEGALLYLGDVHASMGDGEVCGLGLEICARVTVRVELLKGATIDQPVVEDREVIATTGIGDEFYEAVEIAVNGMVRRLQQKRPLSMTDAYMLVSCFGDLRVNQACRGLPIKLGVRMEMPKSKIAL